MALTQEQKDTIINIMKGPANPILTSVRENLAKEIDLNDFNSIYEHFDSELVDNELESLSNKSEELFGEILKDVEVKDQDAEQYFIFLLCLVLKCSPPHSAEKL